MPAKSRGYSQYNPMPCNRLAYRTASCRSKLGTSTLMAEAKGSCGVSPDPSHHLTTHGIYANALGLFLSFCLSSATRTGGARAMWDAGYAHRRGEGARSDQQPPAANHCQLASQPKGLWGSKSRAVANGAEKTPPSVAAAAQQRSPAAPSSIPLAHAVVISGLHLPSPVHARLRLAWSEKGEKKKRS